MTRPRPAALERADGVDRLDLDDDRDAELGRQALVDVLRAVAEGRRESVVGRADGGGLEMGVGDHGGASWCGAFRTHENARRNYRSVVTATNVNTGDAAFGLVAPSGKTDSRRWESSSGRGLIHDFRASWPFLAALSTCYPRWRGPGRRHVAGCPAIECHAGQDQCRSDEQARAERLVEDERAPGDAEGRCEEGHRARGGRSDGRHEAEQERPGDGRRERGAARPSPG